MQHTYSLLPRFSSRTGVYKACSAWKYIFVTAAVYCKSSKNFCRFHIIKLSHHVQMWRHDLILLTLYMASAARLYGIRMRSRRHIWTWRDSLNTAWTHGTGRNNFRLSDMAAIRPTNIFSGWQHFLQFWLKHLSFIIIIWICICQFEHFSKIIFLNFNEQSLFILKKLEIVNKVCLNWAKKYIYHATFQVIASRFWPVFLCRQLQRMQNSAGSVLQTGLYKVVTAWKKAVILFL